MADNKKEEFKIIKLQIPAGKATPAPPVGPALGASGVNIMQFVKEFNDRTANQPGMIIPVVITVNPKDKSFTFVTKVPPVAVLIKKAAKIEKASGKPNKEKVATITKAQVKEIAEQKMPDLNAASLEAAMSMVAGTARSMGVVVGKIQLTGLIAVLRVVEDVLFLSRSVKYNIPFLRRLRRVVEPSAILVKLIVRGSVAR